MDTFQPPFDLQQTIGAVEPVDNCFYLMMMFYKVRQETVVLLELYNQNLRISEWLIFVTVGKLLVLFIQICDFYETLLFTGLLELFRRFCCLRVFKAYLGT